MPTQLPGLELDGLYAGYYGEPVVFDVSLRAHVGKVTAVFGHNGAGKTTILRTVAGLVPLMNGRVTTEGTEIGGQNSRAVFRSGVVYLPQDHATFPELTIRENLEMGGLAQPSRHTKTRMDQVCTTFPILAERLRSPARTLSGGQQRMLSIGMALMADARVLLLDEPSLGLAPAVTKTLLEEVQRFVRDQQRTVVLVEQAIGQALTVADEVYVLRSGKIVGHFDREEALARSNWSDVF